MGVWLIACVLALPWQIASAAVESKLRRALDLPSPPLDVAATADGQWTFVLLEGGEIRIYGSAGDLQGTIRVGDRAERIAPSPSGDQVYVTFRGEKQLKAFSVEFSYSIDVTGSPFKGPSDAPVVIAVFSDFQ
jgi:hypothetical protein